VLRINILKSYLGLRERASHDPAPASRLLLSHDAHLIGSST
jgi:hypothetical protein